MDHWTFRHQVGLVTVTARKRFTDDLLASRINISRIKIIYAAVDGAAYNADGLRFILGEPHTAEAKARHPHPSFAKIDIFHKNTRLFIIFI